MSELQKREPREVITIFGKRLGDKIEIDEEKRLLTVKMESLGGMITVTCEFPRSGINLKCEALEPPTLNALFNPPYPE